MTTSSAASSTLLAPAPAAPLLRQPRLADRFALERILRGSDAFTDVEVAVALEVIDLGLRSPGAGYSLLVAELDGGIAGYACYGPAPLTDAVFDFYWLAVDPARRGRGVGRALLRAVEAAVASQRGRMLLVETSSKPSYAAAQALYEGAGYAQLARIPDYYRPGDDKLIYGKQLGANGRGSHGSTPAAPACSRS